MTKSTHELLRDWGVFQRHPDMRMNARCGIALVMDANVGSTVGEPFVSWDEVSQVDAVLAKLKKRNRNLYQVIWFSYVDDLSSREMGARINKDRNAALSLLNQAVNWVDGAMFAGGLEAEA